MTLGLADVYPVPPQLFRLYHDAQGRPLFYSMQDLPGLYIDISVEEFHQAKFRVRVVNGRIEPMPLPLYPRLVPSDHGQLCHKQDVCIISQDADAQHWSLSDETN
jgi:hypothetical protein